MRCASDSSGRSARVASSWPTTRRRLASMISVDWQHGHTAWNSDSRLIGDLSSDAIPASLRAVAGPRQGDRRAGGVGRGHLDLRDALVRAIEPLAERGLESTERCGQAAAGRKRRTAPAEVIVDGDDHVAPLLRAVVLDHDDVAFHADGGAVG